MHQNKGWHMCTVAYSTTYTGPWWLSLPMSFSSCAICCSHVSFLRHNRNQLVLRDCGRDSKL